MNIDEVFEKHARELDTMSPKDKDQVLDLILAFSHKAKEIGPTKENGRIALRMLSEANECDDISN